jgi:hypothetical protein
MARLVRAIHFPEAEIVLLRLWKMDGRHEGGHDDAFWTLIVSTPGSFAPPFASAQWGGCSAGDDKFFFEMEK